MANPDLEQYLATLRGAGQDLGGAFERLAKNEQQQGLRDIYAGAEDRIAAGDVLGVASDLGNMGDPELFRDMVKARATAQSKGPGLTAEFLKRNYNLDDATANDIASRPAAEQRELANDIVKQRQFNTEQAAFNRSQTRLEEDRFGKPKDWFDKTQKIENQISEQNKTFKSVKGALAKGTQPADAIVLNFIARFVAGEKGPLAEGDITRLKGKAAEEDWNKVTEYLSSGGKSTLTPLQRKAYEELVDQTVQNYEKYNEDLLTTQLGGLTRYEGTLFNAETGKIDKRAERYLKDYGFQVKKDKDDIYRIEKSMSKTREDVASDSQGPISKPSGGQSASGAGGQKFTLESPVIEIIGSIKDPQAKAEAEAYIKQSQATGKPVSQKVIQEFIRLTE